MISKNIIITGGGGSGKTTLINNLAKLGFNCMPEVSRQIIKEQQCLNGDLMPWANLKDFANECLLRMNKQLKHNSNTLTFFDRGVPDIMAYLLASNKTVPEHYYEYIKQYNSYVFICPPWHDIFINDEQRPESYDYSKNIYRALLQTYIELGFTLIEIPRTCVDNRVQFILNFFCKNQDALSKNILRTTLSCS